MATTAVHTTGAATMAPAGFQLRQRLERRKFGLPHAVLIGTGVIGTVGLSPPVLYATEFAIRAAACFLAGARDTPMKAMLCSIDPKTTRGGAELRLPPRWRMMGALAAADGMILFGIGAAFIFAMRHSPWPLLQRLFRFRRD